MTIPYTIPFVIGPIPLPSLDPYVERALGLLAFQFRDKPNIKAMVAALAEQVEGLEDALLDVYATRNLETAQGTQLDVLGRVVGLERQGLTDEEYRLHLRAKILLNRSSGTPGEIFDVFSLLMSDVGTLPVLSEQFPAAFVLQLDGYPLAYAVLFAQFLRQAKAAGVLAQMAYQETADADTFDFFENSTGTGFTDEATGLTGGDWANVRE